ncbi:hypothetical protein TIFTF001_017563 [Ficus carica]|uniref:Uncharacterized protein n=1 Tax=Ficus carica TaxID=3494 RepID=A0AA88A596_FICCA|nr:hypothetical protein TIFTF001_017563 [Ficus carica]
MEGASRRRSRLLEIVGEGASRRRSRGRGRPSRFSSEVVGNGGFLPEVARRVAGDFVGVGDSQVGDRVGVGWPNPYREWVKGDRGVMGSLGEGDFHRG